jgi:hypothetical protein
MTSPNMALVVITPSVAADHAMGYSSTLDVYTISMSDRGLPESANNNLPLSSSEP